MRHHDDTMICILAAGLAFLALVSWSYEMLDWMRDTLIRIL